MRSILSLHYALSSSSAEDTQQQSHLPHISDTSEVHSTVYQHDNETVHVAACGAKGRLQGGGTVPWVSLYQGADTWDVLALVVGTLGAIVNGLVFPLFSLIFGEVRVITLCNLRCQYIYANMTCESGSVHHYSVQITS